MHVTGNHHEIVDKGKTRLKDRNVYILYHDLSHAIVFQWNVCRLTYLRLLNISPRAYGEELFWVLGAKTFHQSQPLRHCLDMLFRG